MSVDITAELFWGIKFDHELKEEYQGKCLEDLAYDYGLGALFVGCSISGQGDTYIIPAHDEYILAWGTRELDFVPEKPGDDVVQKVIKFLNDTTVGFDGDPEFKLVLAASRS